MAVTRGQIGHSRVHLDERAGTLRNELGGEGSGCEPANVTDPPNVP
jgi:hypothetical protein